MKHARSGTRHQWVLALAGIGLGLGMLWMAFRITDLADVQAAIKGLRWPLVLVAVALYWVGMGLRILR
jgi:hypothetical protein